MDWGNAILAGLVATAVMTVLMYLGKAMGMPMDMPRMLGLTFTAPDSTSPVYALGLMAHLMMGVSFAFVYAVLFDLLGVDANWLWGAVHGAVHGVIVGMAFGMMPAMHPRMGPGEVLAGPGMLGPATGRWCRWASFSCTSSSGPSSAASTAPNLERG